MASQVGRAAENWVVGMSLGPHLVAATVAGTKWGPNDIPTTQFSSALPTWLAILANLGIALGAVAANVINIYSGALSFLTLNLRIPFRQRRAIVAVVAGAIGLLIGIVFQAQVGPGGKYEYFLLLISYWISPFLGVVITDYWIRRGRIRESTRRRRLWRLFFWLTPIAAYIYWRIFSANPIRLAIGERSLGRRSQLTAERTGRSSLSSS